MELNSQIFTWGNYEEDPKNIMGIDTLPTQKSATYNSAADGVFTGSIEESFFTNIDKSLVSNPAMVIGEVAMELVEGKGTVASGVEIHYITNADEYDAAMDPGTVEGHTEGYLHAAGYPGTTWADGMSWAVATFRNIAGTLTVLNKGAKATVLNDGTTPVENAFPVTTKSTYFIIDKGEVKNCESVNDITFIVEG